MTMQINIIRQFESAKKRRFRQISAAGAYWMVVVGADVGVMQMTVSSAAPLWYGLHLCTPPSSQLCSSVG